MTKVTFSPSLVFGTGFRGADNPLKKKLNSLNENLAKLQRYLCKNKISASLKQTLLLNGKTHLVKSLPFDGLNYFFQTQIKVVSLRTQIYLTVISGPLFDMDNDSPRPFFLKIFSFERLKVTSWLAMVVDLSYSKFQAFFFPRNLNDTQFKVYKSLGFL